MILGITRRQKTASIEIKRVHETIVECEPLIEIARRRKLKWFGHVSRRAGTLACEVTHVSVKGSRGKVNAEIHDRRIVQNGQGGAWHLV